MVRFLWVCKWSLPYILAGAIAVVTLYVFYSSLGILAASTTVYSAIADISNGSGDKSAIYLFTIEAIVSLLAAIVGGVVAWILLSLMIKYRIRIPIIFYSAFFLVVVLASDLYWSSSFEQEFRLSTQIKLMFLEMLEVLPLLLVPIFLVLRRNRINEERQAQLS
jgi:MFS family permease